MSQNVLDLWDSLKIIWLYVRHREEIDNDYPTHWRYDKWVFEISFPEETLDIIPRLQSPIKIINEYFFEEIIDEIYLEITNYEDSKEEFLSFKKEDRIKFINDDKDSFWYSPEILDFSKYPSDKYYFSIHIKVNEKKMKEKLNTIMSLWIDRKYSFYPYQNTLKIEKELETVVKYLIEKLHKYDPNNLYVSIGEIYDIEPEERTRTVEEEFEDWTTEEKEESYFIYNYRNYPDNFDVIATLFYLDSIGTIYIQGWFFGFHRDEEICFRITVLEKFYEEFYDCNDIDNAILKALAEKGIETRKIRKSDSLLKIQNLHKIQYSDLEESLILNWKPKRLFQKQKIFIEGLFDLSPKSIEGWVTLEELAIYDDHSFEDQDEKIKEKVIKNFYNIGNHLNKTIQLESGIEKALEINLKSVRLNPKYIS